MSFPNSAGVYAREIDASITTIQQSGSPAAFGGEFNWGPVNKRKLITNETQLVETYQAPKKYTTDFHIASQFLKYSNNLITNRISNGVNAIGRRNNNNTPFVCTPFDFDMPGQPEFAMGTSSDLVFYYTLNGGETQEFFLLDNATWVDQPLQYILRHIFFELGLAPIGPTALTPFYVTSEKIIAGYDGYDRGLVGGVNAGVVFPTISEVETTITFEAYTGTSDFFLLNEYFGITGVTITSCAIIEWPGV